MTKRKKSIPEPQTGKTTQQNGQAKAVKERIKLKDEEDYLNTIDNEAESSDSEGSVAQSDEERDEPIFQSDDEDDDELSFESGSSDDDSQAESDDDNDEDEDDEDEDDDNDEGESEDSDKATNNSVSNTKQDIAKKSNKEHAKINNSKLLNKDNKNIKLAKNVPEKIKQKSKSTTNTTTPESSKSQEGETLDPSKDEYESGDTSDEEDRRNTVGEIPMQWYNEYKHIGYDLNGKQILKPPQRDQIEDFLKRCEDPDFWRTVKDPMTGQDIVLSKEDLEVMARLRSGKTPDANYEDYPEWIEWFSSDVLQTPVRAFPEHKRSFLPSALEQRQLNKIVRALRAGWIKTRKQDWLDREKKKERKFYMLWSADDRAEHMRRIHSHIPAPKRALPGHAESYNPPPEYLLDERELKQWKKLEKTPWKRKYTFLPQKYASLREVPAYSRYTRERFLRCLDLYLAPRAIKMKLTIDPEQLVPKLPNPQDLQPFPTVESMVYRGHTDIVRCIDLDPVGEYLYSGSEDGSVKVWEVSTGRCLKTIKLEEPVKSLQCCPVESLSLLAVVCDKKLLLISPGKDVGDHKIAKRTDELLAESPENAHYMPSDRIRTAVNWDTVSTEMWDLGVRISVSHFKEVKQVNWHGRGDYMCVVIPQGEHRSVIVHQISKRRSQVPFSKCKGLVQCALFHPIRPYLFVATQKIVRIYDLLKQELVKKLLTSAQWVSWMAVHPAGDNLLVASYDRKMMWFDLDLSSKPYQTLRLHSAAVRGVAFHKRYPLFASGSDDRKLIVSHGMVYNDLLQNPLIVPLKQLQTHEEHEDFGIMAVQFHPYQPWVFSAGADATIRLYT